MTHVQNAQNMTLISTKGDFYQRFHKSYPQGKSPEIGHI